MAESKELELGGRNLANLASVSKNLGVPQLIEDIIRNGEGVLAAVSLLEVFGTGQGPAHSWDS